MQSRAERREKRHQRVRRNVLGTSERPRLSVFKSAKHITAQIINDLEGRTLVSASTVEKDLKNLKGRATCEGAKRIGELVAERANAKGIDKVVFDRGGYIFHGKVKALADAAREKGLKF
ncbi:MAG: 50S ribosomal protein L18 [Deltaproteobacteria bacterium CG07_land_8_20_14_0_80_38_7]|nr:MAG: 50S ribosomal protein L18 [Deltaproteobacteria bacterium CG07_land_8_20_14_0_80_38_7]